MCQSFRFPFVSPVSWQVPYSKWLLLWLLLYVLFVIVMFLFMLAAVIWLDKWKRHLQTIRIENCVQKDEDQEESSWNLLPFGNSHSQHIEYFVVFLFVWTYQFQCGSVCDTVRTCASKCFFLQIWTSFKYSTVCDGTARISCVISRSMSA